MTKPNEEFTSFPPLTSSAERLQLQKAVEEAEKDIAEGNWTEHREVMKKLKRWVEGR